MRADSQKEERWQSGGKLLAACHQQPQENGREFRVGLQRSLPPAVRSSVWLSCLLHRSLGELFRREKNVLSGAAFADSVSKGVDSMMAIVDGKPVTASAKA